MSLFRHFLLLAALVGAATSTAVFAADNDVRFSATLTTEQRADAGLDQLTADNVAVIDGLVRQDTAASKYRNNIVDGTRFSQRRTDRERSLAGLEHLNAAQLARLDRLVHRRIAGPEADAAADATLIAPRPAAPLVGVKPTVTPHPLEIHGQVSYTMGWSKGGSFQGGDIVLTYDDPKDRFSVLVGYSEYRGKGLPWCFYPGTGPYLSRPDLGRPRPESLDQP